MQRTGRRPRQTVAHLQLTSDLTGQTQEARRRLAVEAERRRAPAERPQEGERQPQEGHQEEHE